MGSRAKRRKFHLTISGKTQDGKLVISNIFPLIDGCGVPLEYVLQYIKNNNCVIDWFEFIMMNLKHNKKLESVLKNISESLLLVYGEEYKNTIMDKLYKYCK